ncbi:(2Fe-2S) ferredoxin domain-containing protein [Planktothrix sp. FACHB-1355]|uniref:(2Fe-2S) ferredoxin domain-containing protein n=2 Tax=Cyanophyceae TaxID=3028117 RepID=A0A926VHX5_9CYAN|nr:(2Fe-2S) ferredoxin domain-containing protein [Aerosakkonema funiforme FACHB-1375]MBD3562786.1 (2Fe-2S) ferredoxin domain-containing protein [Planktothrix sp. FACHB-1355]
MVNMKSERALQNDSTTSKKVLICQSKTCSKQGAAKVLAAFEEHPVAGVTIASTVCLGQCGQGPMVLIQPEKIWYNRVLPEEVATIIDRHLQGGKPVKSMLYAKFHPQVKD